MAWQVQDAKARFSEFLDASLRDGPQVVTRRGVEAAVLVPMEEWRRLKQAARPTLKQLLLAPGARFDFPVPKRGGLRRQQSRESSSMYLLDPNVVSELRKAETTRCGDRLDPSHSGRSTFRFGFDVGRTTSRCGAHSKARR